jgi:hypothetical protein
MLMFAAQRVKGTWGPATGPLSVLHDDVKQRRRIAWFNQDGGSEEACVSAAELCRHDVMCDS